MRPETGEEPFFIGFQTPPRRLLRFLAGVAVVMVLVAAGLGWLLAATQDDPGDGAFRWDFGAQTVTGTLELNPYPIVHVSESALFGAGHTLMLSGPGKRGVQDRAAGLDGQRVTVTGIVLKRGTLDVLQVNGSANALVAAGGKPLVPRPVDLGRWRVTGEICDGKCYAGAMRPGNGLAHKACANLCLTGGTPPVLVATDEIDGQSFLLLADAAGGPVTDRILDWSAILVQVEGRVERRGDLLVFRIDPDSLKAAR